MAPVVASSRPGYFRKNTGALNPHCGSATFRGLWRAGQSAAPDWIHFYSWDDYGENGHIEPSRINRGFYSALARRFLADWRGSAGETPELWIGAPLSVFHGSVFLMEITGLCGGLAEQKAEVVLRNEAGKEVWTSGTVEIRTEDSVASAPVHVDTSLPAFDAQDVLVPVLRISKGRDSVREISGIPPVRLLPHNPVNPLYRFTRIDRITVPRSFEMASEGVSDSDSHLRFRIETGRPMRRFEVRNYQDRPVSFCNSDSGGMREGDALYLPLEPPLRMLAGTFDACDLDDPKGMYYLFVEYEDGSTWASPPQSIRPLPETESDVLVTGFRIAGEVGGEWIPSGIRRLRGSMGLIADWRAGRCAPGCDEVPDSGAFDHPLYLGMGPNTRLYAGTARNMPEIAETAQGRTLRFDGILDVARLPSGVFPVGSFTVDMELCPVLTGREMTLLYAKHGAVRISLLPDGSVRLQRAGETVTSPFQLISGEWTFLRVGDNGREFFIEAAGTRIEFSHVPLQYDLNAAAYDDLVLVGAEVDPGMIRSNLLFFKDGSVHPVHPFQGDFRRIRLWAGEPADNNEVGKEGWENRRFFN
jgi:hypothetical protein